MKRIVIAVLAGLFAGCICAGGGIAAGIVKLTAVNLIWVFLNRGVMGFAIGVSGLKVHWAWNGIILGIVVGSIFSFHLFMDVGPKLLPLVNFFVNGLFRADDRVLHHSGLQTAGSALPPAGATNGRAGNVVA